MAKHPTIKRSGHQNEVRRNEKQAAITHGLKIWTRHWALPCGNFAIYGGSLLEKSDPETKR